MTDENPVTDKPADDVKHNHDDEEAEDTGLSTADTYVQIFLIQVDITKATDLIKADIFGLSDPYCRVTAFRQTYTTKTIMKTLDPVWEEKTQFIFFKDPKELEFHVWDWDRGTKHDKIGDYSFSLSGFFDKGHTGYSGPLKLNNVKKGELHVTIKCRKLLPVELEKEASNLQDLERHQKGTMANQDHSIQTLIDESTLLSQKNQDLRLQINQLTETKKEMQNKLSALKKQKQSIEDEKRNLTQSRTNVQKELDETSNDCIQSQSFLTAEEDNVSDCRTENEKKKKREIKTCSQELEGLTAQIENLERQIETTKAEIEMKAKEEQNEEQMPLTFTQAKTTPPPPGDSKPTTPLIHQREDAGPEKPANCQCCSLL